LPSGSNGQGNRLQLHSGDIKALNPDDRFTQIDRSIQIFHTFQQCRATTLTINHIWIKWWSDVNLPFVYWLVDAQMYGEGRLRSA
jgi:hypothetical protein